MQRGDLLYQAHAGGPCGLSYKSRRYASYDLMPAHARSSKSGSNAPLLQAVGRGRLRAAPFLLVNRACNHALSLTDQN